MQTLALIPLVVKLTGLTDVSPVTSIITDDVAVDTVKGGDACHVYINWRVLPGEGNKQFSTWEAGGNYQAEAVTCPPGTPGYWDEDPNMLGCVYSTRLNSFETVIGGAEENRSGRLYRFKGSMILSVSAGHASLSASVLPTKGLLTCVSSTCACSFLPNP